MAKNDVFYKVPLSTYSSGIMGELGPHRWFLLCSLASYMDKDGKCWPTQQQLANKLKVSPRTVSWWLKELEEFTYDEKPIITVKRVQVDGKPEGFDHNEYHILPNSGLSIFNNQNQ